MQHHRSMSLEQPPWWIAWREPERHWTIKRSKRSKSKPQRNSRFKNPGKCSSRKKPLKNWQFFGPLEKVMGPGWKTFAFPKLKGYLFGGHDSFRKLRFNLIFLPISWCSLVEIRRWSKAWKYRPNSKCMYNAVWDCHDLHMSFQSSHQERHS